jgi:hypothetical protein
MNRSLSQLEVLEAQARQGNVLARERLRKLLGPGIAVMVRRTLQTGRGDTAVARHILREHRRVGTLVPFCEGTNSHALIDLIARRVTEQLLDGSRAPAGSADPSRETVVDLA